MLKWALISIVIVPVLLGIELASARRLPRRLPTVLLAFFIYCVLYMCLVVFLRHHWGKL